MPLKGFERHLKGIHKTIKKTLKTPLKGLSHTFFGPPP